jgi:hypothetical protein
MNVVCFLELLSQENDDLATSAQLKNLIRMICRKRLEKELRNFFFFFARTELELS